ncbi:hypothetical protein [Enterococcus hermanniensis]|uniref:Uncharacterized protein n=1 Tax=Enterococcus hermanniensis TaxID=249189 RepID=A0A1L8TMP7_9ENTE|nr:hypothetical protein [Enterococcus hermanniensis]OJG45550.1 hypothetical protein RV04_GL001839 [Enterococcus hermanniensis]
MRANGSIIRQQREAQQLTYEDLKFICSSDDLMMIEQKNEGILEIILDLCQRLEVPYHKAFSKATLSSEVFMLHIIRCLHLRQEFSAILFLLDTFGNRINYENTRIVGHLFYFRAYATLFYRQDTQKAVHYFQRASTFLNEEKRYELLVLKGLATCYQANQEKKRARIFFERAEQVEENMMHPKELGLSYCQAARFFAQKGQYQQVNDLCDEGIQTLLEINITEGLEELFFEKAIAQSEPAQQLELLKQANYYAAINQNNHFEKQINDRLIHV